MHKRTYRATRLACYLGYIVQAVVNNLPPLLFIIFQEELGISYGLLSVTILLNFLTQLVVDLLSVPLTAKLGPRRTMVGSHILAAAGLLMLGILPRVLPSPFVGILIATVTYAVGSGMIEVMVSPVVDHLPVDGGEGRKAAGMALLHSFYCWGSVLTVALSTVALKLVGAAWYVVPMLWALLPLGNLINMLTVPLPALETADRTALGGLLRHPELWLFFGCMLCSGASEIAVAQWASLLTEQSLGLPKLAGDLLGPCLFAVVMGIGRTLYGLFGERWPLEKVLIGSAALCIGGYLLTALSGAAALSLVGCCVCGLAVSIMWPGTLSNASARVAGCTAVYALLSMGGDLGAASGPALAGWVADATGNLPDGILAATIFPVLMLSLSLILFLRRKREK